MSERRSKCRQRQTKRGTHWRELDIVTTCATVGAEGHIYPSGSVGMIVHVYGEGDAFEIEFAAPAPAVVTLEAIDIGVLKWRR